VTLSKTGETVGDRLSLLIQDDIEERLEMHSIHESDYREALAMGDLKRMSGVTDNLIEEESLEVVKGSSEYVALARELLKKSIEVLQGEQQLR
jgi:hypothetical protein